MAELRTVFERAGCAEVSTFIASGNVLFRGGPGRAALEDAFAEAFGFETTIVVRTAAQLRRLAQSEPFGPRTPECFVAFLGGRPTAAALRAFAASDYPDDAWEKVGGDLALHYPSAFHRARLTVARLEQLLGVPATLRNWRTVTKLAELAA